MKLKSIITAAGALLAACTMAQAAHIWEDSAGWWDSHFSYDKNAPRYNANEVSLDLFGSYLNPEQKFTKLFETNIRHGFWGGGAGVNYFFSKFVGIGSDFNISDKPGGNWDFDYVVGNIYLRAPVGNSGVAPYIYGGGGRGFSSEFVSGPEGGTRPYDWLYGGGVGLEYRFNPSTGIFTDARFYFSDKATVLNELVIRAGVRLTF